MSLRLPLLLTLFLSCRALQAAPPEGLEKLLRAERASELHASDADYFKEVAEALSALLAEDPAKAVELFLHVRQQVAADRAAGTASTGTSERSGDRGRSLSVPAAALATALQRVEKPMRDGDDRLPRTIAAAAEMLAADRGCGVESCSTASSHLGWMLIKSGRAADGTFTVQRLLETLGPVIKPEWLPALLGAARGTIWNMKVKDDPAALTWLEQQAKEGAHRELAMLLLTAGRICSQETDAGNKPHAGIMARAELPAEQLWLLELLEKKSSPPALRASLAAEVVRVWPAAEPPLRHACAQALVAAWMADAPVNTKEAGWIVESLTLLANDGALPQDEGFFAAAQALTLAWKHRLERNRTPLYGWPAEELRDAVLPGRLLLLARGAGAESAAKLLNFLTAEAGKDATLVSLMRLSESLQRIRFHAEAATVLASISAGQEKDDNVSDETRLHLSIKRAHVPLQAAAGMEAASRATVTLLTERPDDPAAWTGAAWAWHNRGMELRADGQHEEALRHFCFGCIMARAAVAFAPDTHARYQPAAEGAGREELVALKLPPDRIRMLRTVKGVEILLEESGDAWKALPKPARNRLLDAADL